MKHWFYHGESESYFLESEDYTEESGEEVFKLDYTEEIDEKMVIKLHTRDGFRNRFISTNFEVVKPKINNWSNLLSKVRSIYDSWNLKVKHATDEYVNLPNTPDIDDILHWVFSKKKSLFELNELLSFFGENRRNLIENSINILITKDVILGYSFQDGNILQDWQYAETDKFSINVNYNG